MARSTDRGIRTGQRNREMAEINQDGNESQVKVRDPYMRELRTAMVIDAICGVFFLGFYLFCRSRCPDYRPFAWMAWTGAFFRLPVLYCYIHCVKALGDRIEKWSCFRQLVLLLGVPWAVMAGIYGVVEWFSVPLPLALEGPLTDGACIAFSGGLFSIFLLFLIKIASYMLKARVRMKWCAWTIWSCILWGWVSSVCFSHFRGYDPFLCLLAPLGNAEAQFDLGVCYSRGDIFSQSMEKAVKWCRKAAEQGDSYAQSALGRCYANGDGVKQSYEEAVKWYRKAAEQVNPDVWYALGECYENGNGVEQSFEYATAWYEAAAKRYRCFAEEYDSAKAKYRLGGCYERGRGVEQSLEEAEKWYRKAAEQGIEKAKAALERLQKKGKE